MFTDSRDGRDIALRAESKRAVASDHLVLLHQPRVDIRNRRVVGAGAVVRWRHPVLGAISPAHLVGLADEREVSYGVDKWIINEACRQLRAWQDAGASDWCIAVNLSPFQLRRQGFYSALRETLADHRIDADRLILELTEFGLMHDIVGGLRSLYNLLGLGVQISLGEFGAGFSSLPRLKRMPIHEVRIAGGFVAELDRSVIEFSIVRAMIEMARAMDLHVLAEGVEREEQVVCLAEIGCHQSQGVLHGAPVGGDAFLDLYTDATAIGVPTTQAPWCTHGG